MKEVGRGQSLKVFPRVCIQDFLKGGMWISRDRKESRMTPRFVSVEGAGWDGTGGSSGSATLSYRGPRGGVLARDRSLRAVSAGMIFRAVRLDEGPKGVVQREKRCRN